MLGLVSNSSTLVATDAFKAILPISIGIASVAFLTMKMVTPNTDKVRTFPFFRTHTCPLVFHPQSPFCFSLFRIGSLILGFSFTLQRDTFHPWTCASFYLKCEAY